MSEQMRDQYLSQDIIESYVAREQYPYNVWYEALEHRPAGLMLELTVDERLLDVGCGIGSFSRYISQSVKEIYNIDYSFPMLLAGCSKNIEVPTSSENIYFIRSNALMLPFPSEHFNGVVSFGLLENVADLKPFLAEWSRVLRDGGRLVLSCHHAGYGVKRNGARWARGELKAHRLDSIVKVAEEYGLVPGQYRYRAFVSNRLVWTVCRRLPTRCAKYIFLNLMIFVNYLIEKIGVRIFPKQCEQAAMILICFKKVPNHRQ